jgi:hypothetical protein
MSATVGFPNPVSKLPIPAMGNLGMENRPNILPQMTTEEGPGLLGPDYDFSDNIPMPDTVGARPGSDMGSVFNAMGAAAYYVDMIGFGESTNPLSSGRGVKPLGVNYFVKTGLKCPNNEDMWIYIKGIPEGTALGTRVKNAMARMGLPGLKGLAPGAIEDVKDALDPNPVLNAVFGSGYPDCVRVTLPVGDQDGRWKKPLYDDNGNIIGEGAPYIVGRPENQSGGAYTGGTPYQTRWIQRMDRNGRPINLTKEQYEAQQKSAAGGKPQGFSPNPMTQDKWLFSALVGVIGVVCVGHMFSKK